jgi:hypothetical protein
MTILDCIQIDILHSALLQTSLSPPSRLWLNVLILILHLSLPFLDIGLTLVIHPLVQSQTPHPFPFCFGHSLLQPFLCWFLPGICPEVALNSFHTCQDCTLGLSDPKGFGLSLYAVPLSRVLPRISRVQR